MIPSTEQQQRARLIRTTFELKDLGGVHVPFQNGIPVPSFDPQKRLKLDLAGEWRKQRFDADHDFSLSLRDTEWFARVREEAEGRYEAGFDDSGWERIRLPLPENRLTGKAEAGAAETYENGVWYRRTFELGAEWQEIAVTLHALAVNYVCDLWVNGEWVGYHEGGFTPFAVDLTPFVRFDGPNVIAFRIDNPPWGSRDDIIPAMEGTDFFNYTGIIHDLYLSGTCSVHIPRVQAVPLDTEGRVKFTAVIENRSETAKDVKLEGALFHMNQELDGFLGSPLASDSKGEPAAWNGKMSHSLALAPRETKALEVMVQIENPSLWSFHAPNLYIGEWRLLEDDGSVLDTFQSQFGIRTVTTEGTKLLLNGKSAFLAGIARHEEWPDFGRTASWDRIRNDLLQMKDVMHVNFVRTAHYPNHVYTSMLLDRLGLATASEIPLWQFRREHYEIQAEKRLSDQMWREMIFSQYNRPSVLMWSTQNESVEVELRTKYNIRVVRDWKDRYYDGRLSTQSAAADQPGAHDPTMEPLDVAGWTMYFGIFHGGTYYEGTRQFLQDAHERWPNKPIWNTEFGHWSGDGDALASEQLLNYRETFRALMESAAMNPDGSTNPDGFLAGIDFWIMYDWYVNHNQWIDTFGVFHMDRNGMKPVGEAIRNDYKRLTAHRGGFLL